ncbi:hypothetical protein [Kitasatospora sp. NPDC089509]
MDGVAHTVCTAVIPRELRSEYKVTVQRDGQQAEERLELNMDGVGSPAQC